LEKLIKNMKNHSIVCGYGRMGRIICQELLRKKVPFVVIEKDPQEEDFDDRMPLIQGDATNDDTLKQAGIEKASNLISVLSSDVNNLYAVMSARELNPNLYIVARAAEESAQEKLRRAGATKVVLPYDIGGHRIVNAVLRPAVVDFIEFSTTAQDIEIQMEEIFVEENSPLADKTIQEMQVGREYGVIIIAIKRRSGQMNFNPMFNTIIQPGDTLIVMCEKEKIDLLRKLTNHG